MGLASRSSAVATSSLPLVAAGALAISIFVFDTATPFGMAVAVLYVVVVLIAGTFLQRRGIVLTSVACAGLTVLSYVLSHGSSSAIDSFVRCLMSLSAIGITTLLVLKNQRQEAKISQQENDLRLAIDTIPTLVSQSRTDGFVEYLNRRWLDYTGLSLEQASGWGWQVVVHPDDLTNLLDRRRAIMAAGQAAEIEARLRRHDGEYRWFLIRTEPLRGERGTIAKWYTANIDIQDRKVAEDALRRSEAYLEEAQRLSLTGSFGWRSETREFVWSEETYRIFGYEPALKPTIGLIRQRVHPDDLALVQGAIDRASQQGCPIDLGHRLLMPDGAIKHLKVRAHLTADRSPDWEFIGAVTDVSAAKRAEEALQRSQAELAHATRVATLGELAASIVHEVNQPLAAIVTNGDASLHLLDRQPPELEEVRGAVAAMIRDGHRAAEVIRRLRALARKADPQMASLDINDVVREVLGMVEREILIHRVAARTELASDLVGVLGDRVQLQQVIINLVMNAIDAMSAVVDRPRELAIRTDPNADGQVVVAVRDCGIGFAPEEEERLFTAFFTTKRDGMGMGLAVSRSIIEAHGGRLWATHNVGPGATFQFTLPAQPAP